MIYAKNVPQTIELTADKFESNLKIFKLKMTDLMNCFSDIVTTILNFEILKLNSNSRTT